MPEHSSPAIPRPGLTPRPGTVPVCGDITINSGIDALTICVEAFDLAGVLKMRTEISVDIYDQDKVDAFGASWRARYDGKRLPPTDIKLLP